MVFIILAKKGGVHMHPPAPPPLPTGLEYVGYLIYRSSHCCAVEFQAKESLVQIDNYSCY